MANQKNVLKVLITYLTTTADEQHQESNFIAGYESSGRIWTGHIEHLEGIGTVEINSAYQYARDNKFDLTFQPSSIGIDSGSIRTMMNQFYIDYGIQSIYPAGNNNFQASVNAYNDNVINTGAGEYQNQTGYRVDFFDIDLNSGGDIPILNINQQGVTASVSALYRFSSTALFVKLSGMTTSAQLSAFGISDHGIPIRFSGLSSSISPLPNNQNIYTNGIFNDFLMITFSTTAGSTAGWQSITSGIVQLGITDTDLVPPSSKVLIRGQDYTFSLDNWGLAFKNVSGFQNALTGAYAINNYLNVDGYGTKYEIVKNLGTGSYTGGGTYRIDTQSNALAYTAGKIAGVKDSLSCSWWEARRRAMLTSTSANNYSAINGYGTINVRSAIDYSFGSEDSLMKSPLLSISLDLDVLSRDVFNLTWDYDFAVDEYEIWFRNSLSAVINAPTSTYTWLPIRLTPQHRNYFKIRPRRREHVGPFSNIVEARYYDYRKIRVNKNTAVRLPYPP